MLHASIRSLGISADLPTVRICNVQELEIYYRRDFSIRSERLLFGTEFSPFPWRYWI